MKKITLLAMFLVAAISSQAQTKTSGPILFDGLYVAKTGSIPAANIEIFTFLRFYADGTVCLQTVSENEPEAVAKWFGTDKKYSQKGTYKIEGSLITIHVDNKNTDDEKLEGFQETQFKGTIKSDQQICMMRDDEKEERCFLYKKTF